MYMQEVQPLPEEIQSGHPFPDHVKSILESFYGRGMSGWGAKHEAMLEEAMIITGLDRDQLKVCCNNDGCIHSMT